MDDSSLWTVPPWPRTAKPAHRLPRCCPPALAPEGAKEWACILGAGGVWSLAPRLLQGSADLWKGKQVAFGALPGQLPAQERHTWCQNGKIQRGFLPFSLGLTISTGKPERYSSLQYLGWCQVCWYLTALSWDQPLPSSADLRLFPGVAPASSPGASLGPPLAFQVLSVQPVLQPTQTAEKEGEKPPRAEALLVSRFMCQWRHNRLIADTVSSKTA